MHVGKGGGAFLIKKKLIAYTVKKSISTLTELLKSNSNQNSRMFIFGVYLPADGNLVSYAYEFNIVEGFNNCYSK